VTELAGFQGLADPAQPMERWGCLSTCCKHRPAAQPAGQRMHVHASCPHPVSNRCTHTWLVARQLCFRDYKLGVPVRQSSSLCCSAALHVCPLSMLQVRLLGEQSDIFKHIHKDSNKWEVARPPNEVRACTLPRTHTLAISLKATHSRRCLLGWPYASGQAALAPVAQRHRLVERTRMHFRSRCACMMHAGALGAANASVMHRMVDQWLLTLSHQRIQEISAFCAPDLPALPTPLIRLRLGVLVFVLSCRWCSACS
jgi:hypothetical protein